MAVTVGDIIRVAARHKWNNIDDVVNVFHVNVGAIPGVGGNNTLFLQDVRAWLISAYTEIQGEMSSEVEPGDITAYNITDDEPIGQISWGAYTGGSGTGDGLPPGVAALVLWRTTVKRTVGKTYLPPFTEGQQANGSLTAGALAAVDQFGTTLRDPFTGANMYQVAFAIYKRSAGTTHVPTGHTASPILAYQRRRRPGTGS